MPTSVLLPEIFGPTFSSRYQVELSFSKPHVVVMTPSPDREDKEERESRGRTFHFMLIQSQNEGIHLSLKQLLVYPGF